jgi:hypothetical protein
MRIIAFIQDAHSIKEIMKSQGTADFRAPPPMPKFIDTTLVRRSAKEERLLMKSTPMTPSTLRQTTSKPRFLRDGTGDV